MAEEKDLESKLILQRKIDDLNDKLFEHYEKLSEKEIDALESQLEQLIEQSQLLDNVEKSQEKLSEKSEQLLNEREGALQEELNLQEQIENLYKEYEETYESLSETELEHLENQILQAEELQKSRSKLEKEINNPLNGLSGLFANIGQGLTGGLKGLATTASESFKESGFGKTINLGAKLFGKSETLGDEKMIGGIREMFTHPDVLKQKKKEAEIAKEALVEGMTDTEKEEFERKEELGASGNLVEGLIGNVGKFLTLGKLDIQAETAKTIASELIDSEKEDSEDDEETTEEDQESNEEVIEGITDSNDKLASIDSALHISPPYLEAIRDTLIFIKSDISAIKDIFVTEERKESAGKKERAAEEQQRHDELVTAQEGTSIPEEDKEIEVKSPGFLEKIGQGLGGGLKGIVTGIFDTIKAFVDGISGVLKSALNLIKTFVDGVGSIIQKIAKIITNTFITLMKGLGKGIAALFKALGKIDPYSLGIGALALGAVTIALIGMATALRIATPALQVFANLIISVLGKIVDFGVKVLVPVIQTIGNTILGLINGLVSFVSTVGNLVITGIQTITASIVELANIPFQNLLGLAAGFVTLGISLAAFGITSAIAIPSLLALGAAALGLSKLLDHEPEKIRNLADGFLILGKSVKGFAKDAKALGGVVLSMAALSAIPFAGKLIDLAIAKTESLNVASTEREGIYNTSDQNQQLKDSRAADQSSMNQNNVISNTTIANSNQSNFIKPQIRDESLHWSMANNLVQTI